MAIPSRQIPSMVVFLSLIVFSCCLIDAASAKAGRRFRSLRGGQGRAFADVDADFDLESTLEPNFEKFAPEYEKVESDYDEFELNERDESDNKKDRSEQKAGGSNYEKVEPDEKVFDVRKFRNSNVLASKDDDDDEDDRDEDNDTSSDGKMILSAFKAACQYEGKARVVIPKGQYKMNTMSFMGPCRATRLVIQLFGNLIGPSDKSKLNKKHWIQFYKVNNVILLGSGGTIDGQGQGVWKKCPDGCSPLPPCNVKFDYSRNMVVKGIRSINPKGFNFHVHSCENMVFENIVLESPDLSPNTDGIHTSNTTNVKILKSTFAVGDDCISIGHGSTNFDISDVKCGPGHGISIGSLGKRGGKQEKPVENIRVKKIVFRGTENGIRIKTFPKPIPNQVSDVYFEDIVMEDVKNPIIIDQEYSTKNAKSSSYVRISGVHIRNVRGTSTTETAVNLICSKKYPCEGLELSNINLKYSGTEETRVNSACINTRPIYRGVQSPAPCRPVFT